jgi:hypothetical protein
MTDKSRSPRGLRKWNPWNWHVRVKWVGFGGSPLTAAQVTTPTIGSLSLSPPVRALGTLNLPYLRVRVSWVGSGMMGRINVWAWGLFILLLVAFALTWFTNVNKVDNRVPPETIQQLGLIVDELSVNGETIRIAHSSVDIGQISNLFDHDTTTLVRGLEDNPFVLDFEFSRPRPITGLVMDFGRMDFDLRVEVYGAEDGQPTLYQSEYRNQPPEPHMELNFVDGPALVTRIYIEIEQFNPPDEPHIHVREVLFKE